MRGQIRKVLSLRLTDAELAQVDELVKAEAALVKNWWEPQPSRSSVIRAAIAQRHTRDVARITSDPKRNTATEVLDEEEQEKVARDLEQEKVQGSESG